MIYKYRAVKLEAITPPKNTFFGKIKRFFRSIFGIKDRPRITRRWITKTEEAIYEGYIKADSMEYAIFELFNKYQLYPLDVQSLPPKEAAAAVRLIHLQELQRKLQN